MTRWSGDIIVVNTIAEEEGTDLQNTPALKGNRYPTSPPTKTHTIFALYKYHSSIGKPPAGWRRLLTGRAFTSTSWAGSWRLLAGGFSRGFNMRAQVTRLIYGNLLIKSEHGRLSRGCRTVFVFPALSQAPSIPPRRNGNILQDFCSKMTVRDEVEVPGRVASG